MSNNARGIGYLARCAGLPSDWAFALLGARVGAPGLAGTPPAATGAAYISD